MKKYYHLFLRGVIGETLFWLVLFLVGLVAGSLYSISLKNQTELFFVLNQITMTPLSHKGNEWALLKESIGIHLIQLIGMWLGGLSKLTFSISLLILWFFCNKFLFAIWNEGDLGELTSFRAPGTYYCFYGHVYWRA